MAYKNVHKRIQRLHSLGLIERVEQDKIRKKREFIHGSVFYRLTTAGIFYLLYKDSTTLTTEGREKIFQNYGDNIIFETFVYPYFKKQTLLQIKSHILFVEIFNYLFKCCEATESIIELLNGPFYQQSRIEELKPIFIWNKVPGDHIDDLLLFLIYEIGLSYSQHPKIEKTDNDKIINVSTETSSATIILQQDKAILTTSTVGWKYELDLVQSNKELVVCTRTRTIEKAIIEKLVYRTEFNVLNLAFTIIMGITGIDFTEATEMQVDDFKILSQDTRVANLLEKTGKAFEDRFQRFVSLSSVTKK
jgi:hypothetical protein